MRYLRGVFPIIEIDVEAGSAVEPMGSKPKFWFDHPQRGPCLFKMTRLGSGEDWSEKLASEFAAILGLPHAEYELAEWKGERGIVTPRLTGQGERLVHGNELLIEVIPTYAATGAEYRTPQHTVGAVARTLEERNVRMPRNWAPPFALTRSVDVFVGYLMLDALIGNTDRHHENWGVIEPSLEDSHEPGLFLAPTFDHASSLGRNESETRMSIRMATRDRGFTVEAYADRARSALYANAADPTPLRPVEAFATAATIARSGANGWCERLASVSDEMFRDIIAKVPESRMSAIQRGFVIRMVAHNKNRLLDICEEL
jgi:hypothetical protein